MSISGGGGRGRWWDLQVVVRSCGTRRRIDQPFVFACFLVARTGKSSTPVLMAAMHSDVITVKVIRPPDVGG